MTPTEKGRFCTSCQKQVIDFSNKSDREIAMFFKKPSVGSVCGRFMDDQLNRNIEIPKKRIPWLKYFFQIAIPAFLASCDHRTQGKVKVTGELTVPKTARELNTREGCTNTVGYIMPETISENNTVAKGLILPQLMVGDTMVTAPKQDVKTKSTILPELKLPVIDKPLLTTAEIKLTANDPIATSEPFETTKGVVALIVEPFGDVRCDSKRASRTVRLLRKIFKDTASTKFKVYPNPIRSNSALNIEWKQKDYRDHLLQLFNQSGQLILSKEISILEGSKLFTMNMPAIISGNYFLKLTSKTTGKSYTEKLIVE